MLFIEGLSALSTIAIAIATLTILYHQHKLRKMEVKFKLYDKRFYVFEKTREALSILARDGHATYSLATIFYHNVFENKFLFNKDIQTFIDDIYELMLQSAEKHELMYPSSGHRGLEIGDERSKISKENGEIIKSLLNKLNELVPQFSPYLSIKDI